MRLRTRRCCLGWQSLLFLGVFWRPVYAPERALVWRQESLRGRARWAAVGRPALPRRRRILTFLSLRTFQAEEPASTVAWWQHIASVFLALVGAALLDLGRSDRDRASPRACRCAGGMAASAG